MRRPPAQRQESVSALEWSRMETRDPDDVPIEPPYEDLDDPELLPDEEDDYPPPGEDDEYPGVEPHEDPLVAP